MHTQRLFEIIYLLMDKKKMTASDLAEHFEVSKRTILRDISTLSAAGVPVYTLQGKGGGIALMDSYVLNKTVLTEDEQNQILFALQGLASLQNKESELVLTRLQSLFNKQNTQWIEVDFSRWGSSESDSRKFDLLKDAILEKQALVFTYVSSYGDKSLRKVYPLKLIFKAKSWYLQAFCLDRQDYRTFKVTRMLSLHTTDESFADVTLSPPPLETKQAPSDMPSSLVSLELVFSPRVAFRVYDEFDEASVEEDDDGCLRVNARMPDDAWLEGFLRSLGDDVKILKRQRVVL